LRIELPLGATSRYQRYTLEGAGSPASKAWAHELKGTVTQTDTWVSGRPNLKSRQILIRLTPLTAVWRRCNILEVVGRTRATARRKICRSSRAERFDAVYLRAAQAYMLISMPTGTSTILGVFQVIPSSQQVWRELHAELEPRTALNFAQVRKIERRTPAHWA
jgi:hypothetical protein